MARRRKKNQPSERREPQNRAGTVAATLGIAGDRASRRKDAYVAAGVSLVILLAIVTVFAQTARHGFINLDDDLYVYANGPVLNGLTSHGVAWAFSGRHADNWHPVTWLSHMLDCQLFGPAAGAHHVTNVLLHAATAILLFLVLRRTTGQFWPSAFVAAVFAIHPLRVESVAWISERKDLLSGLFFMLTLAAYTAYVCRPFSMVRYATVAVPYALGLMSKPMLVTLPCLLLLLDYWPLGRMARMRTGIGPTGWRFPFPWRLIIEKIPLLLLAAVSCAITKWAQGRAIISADSIPIWARIGNAMISYVAYVRQMLCPVDLAVFYPHPQGDLPIWKAVAAFFALTGVSTAVVLWRRRFPYLFVGWLWYIGMLVPVIGLVQVGLQAMADRYTYLPQIGLYIAVAWGFADWVSSMPRLRRACQASAAVVILFFVGCAWWQTTFWRDRATLWSRALACTSTNVLAHNNLGTVLARRGEIDQAIAHFEEAIQHAPRYVEAHNNLGSLLAGRGQTAAAIEHFRIALDINPQWASAYSNLANVLLMTGDVDGAVQNYRIALGLNPLYADGHYSLSVALQRQGKIAEAIDEMREVARLLPTQPAVLNRLAWMLATYPDASIRNGREAVAIAERAVQLSNAQEPAVLGTLAAAYAETGQFPEATRTARRAAELATQQNKPSLAKTITEKISLYEAKRPFRQPAPSTSPQQALPQQQVE